MNNQRSRMFRESARYTSSKETSNNTTNSIKGKPQQTKIRCKYCHRLGHTDYDCQSKAQKRPLLCLNGSLRQYVQNAKREVT